MSYTYDFPRPSVTTDIVVFSIRDGVLQVLLIERNLEPFKGAWAIPGGFVQMDEDLLDGALPGTGGGNRACPHPDPAAARLWRAPTRPEGAG